MADRLLIVAFHDDVAGKREVRGRTDTDAVFGDVCKPMADGKGRRFIGDVFTFKPDMSTAGAQTGYDLDQFALTIAGDTSDAEDFAIIQREIDIAQGGQVFVVNCRDVFEAQDFPTTFLFAFMQIKNHFATDHE